MQLDRQLLVIAALALAPLAGGCGSSGGTGAGTGGQTSSATAAGGSPASSTSGTSGTGGASSTTSASSSTSTSTSSSSTTTSTSSSTSTSTSTSTSSSASSSASSGSGGTYPQCWGQGTVNGCFNCCVTAVPNGYTTAKGIIGPCVCQSANCGANSACATQFCAGPTDTKTCNQCLNFALGGACTSEDTQCHADATCNEFVTCFLGCT